jgi:hypothetical protein
MRIGPEVSNLQDPPDWWEQPCMSSPSCRVSDAGALLLGKLFPFDISLLMTSHPISGKENLYKVSLLQ